MSDEIIVGGIIVMAILFGGEPDLMSAIIHLLMRCP